MKIQVLHNNNDILLIYYEKYNYLSINLKILLNLFVSNKK